MTPRLSIRGLGVTYRRDSREVEALVGVDLDVGVGEKLAVIGESGSGKSTLALAVAGLLPASAKIAGKIEFPSLRRPPVNGRDVGFVFQDPSASLNPVLTVGEQIAEVARAHRGMNWRQSLSLAEEMLGRVRLPEPAVTRRAYPHQLSGGQKQRVAIAAAIAGKPELLIADEATSALDTIVQQEIVALIRQLVDEDGMSLLFIAHDIALASEIADRIAVFSNGRLVETGETQSLIVSPRNAYTRSLLAAHLGLEGVSPDGIVR
jgi:peptide/nickel transport system ATP-binding protein